MSFFFVIYVDFFNRNSHVLWLINSFFNGSCGTTSNVLTRALDIVHSKYMALRIIAFDLACQTILSHFNIIFQED